MSKLTLRAQLLEHASNLAWQAKYHRWKVGDHDKYHDRLVTYANLKADFADYFGVRPIKFGGYNLARLLNLTGADREEIDDTRTTLCALGLGNPSCIGPGGVFDHGEIWGRAGKPFALVGHPYQITDDEKHNLTVLDDLGTVTVAVDDRPSYYGHGTHHVRISLHNPT